MKYTIFSINDDRLKFIVDIRDILNRRGWQECYTDCIDGADADALAAAIESHGYAVKQNCGIKVGQLGIWYTVLNSLQHAPHITFEDDGILGTNFFLNLELRMREMPEDMDFFSLFIPRNQNDRYREELSVGRSITKTYSSYGGVSMYYSKQGVEKIRALLERDGITGQYDDTLYEYSRTGELNGYCSKPILPDLVYITGRVPSIVQESRFYE